MFWLRFTLSILCKVSDRGGGVPLRKIDRLFTYTYSTAPRPGIDDSRAAPLVSDNFMNVKSETLPALFKAWKHFSLELPCEQRLQVCNHVCGSSKPGGCCRVSEVRRFNSPASLAWRVLCWSELSRYSNRPHRDGGYTTQRENVFVFLKNSTDLLDLLRIIILCWLLLLEILKVLKKIRTMFDLSGCFCHISRELILFL